jgi:ubiquinone/menaquinone biosynthesis C-methylase UbiE
MDSEEQTRAYAEADFESSNQLFTDRLLDAFPELPATGFMADLGCGPADICIRIARRLNGWTICGIDAGENMLRRAREAVREAGLQNRITLKHGYLPDPQLGRHAYDAVTSNSLLHHLPDPMTLWTSIRQLGRPDAPVLVMDLVRPENEADAAALVDAYAADAPVILREDFYNSLLAAYTVEEIKQQLAAAGLAHFTVSRPSDRHWLAAGRLPR